MEVILASPQVVDAKGHSAVSKAVCAQGAARRSGRIVDGFVMTAHGMNSG
jgi:hypothetical protein